MLEERFFSRNDVAKALGVSRDQIVRKEKAGTLGLHGVRNEKGHLVYAESEVKRLIRAQQEHIEEKASPIRRKYLKSITSSYDNETASRVFEAIEQKVPFHKIVISLKVHPEELIAITKHWETLCGGFFVSGEQADKIAALPISGTFPIESGEVLLGNLEQSLGSGGVHCAKCKRLVTKSAS